SVVWASYPIHVDLRVRLGPLGTHMVAKTGCGGYCRMLVSPKRGGDRPARLAGRHCPPPARPT
ncbi:MAG: hypothetical protein ACRDG4_04615, partial [Chloroflexota bacterium]